MAGIVENMDKEVLIGTNKCVRVDISYSKLCGFIRMCFFDGTTQLCCIVII